MTGPSRSYIYVTVSNRNFIPYGIKILTTRSWQAGGMHGVRGVEGRVAGIYAPLSFELGSGSE